MYLSTVYFLRQKIKRETLMYANAQNFNFSNGIGQHDHDHHDLQPPSYIYDNYQRYKRLQVEILTYIICVCIISLWIGLKPFLSWINLKADIIEIIHSAMSPLQGAVNCLLFFNNSSIRKRIVISSVLFSRVMPLTGRFAQRYNNSNNNGNNDNNNYKNYHQYERQYSNENTLDSTNRHNNNNNNGVGIGIGIGIRSDQRSQHNLYDIEHTGDIIIPNGSGLDSSKLLDKDSTLTYQSSGGGTDKTPLLERGHSSWPYPEIPMSASLVDDKYMKSLGDKEKMMHETKNKNTNKNKNENDKNKHKHKNKSKNKNKNKNKNKRQGYYTNMKNKIRNAEPDSGDSISKRSSILSNVIKSITQAVTSDNSKHIRLLDGVDKESSSDKNRFLEDEEELTNLNDTIRSDTATSSIRVSVNENYFGTDSVAGGGGRGSNLAPKGDFIGGVIGSKSSKSASSSNKKNKHSKRIIRRDETTDLLKKLQEEKAHEKIVEIDVCRFNSSIIDNYRLFITTFNMADYDGHNKKRKSKKNKNKNKDKDKNNKHKSKNMNNNSGSLLNLGRNTNNKQKFFNSTQIGRNRNKNRNKRNKKGHQMHSQSDTSFLSAFAKNQLMKESNEAETDENDNDNDNDNNDNDGMEKQSESGIITNDFTSMSYADGMGSALDQTYSTVTPTLAEDVEIDQSLNFGKIKSNNNKNKSNLSEKAKENKSNEKSKEEKKKKVDGDDKENSDKSEKNGKHKKNEEKKVNEEDKDINERLLEWLKKQIRHARQEGSAQESKKNTVLPSPLPPDVSTVLKNLNDSRLSALTAMTGESNDSDHGAFLSEFYTTPNISLTGHNNVNNININSNNSSNNNSNENILSEEVLNAFNNISITVPNTPGSRASMSVHVDKSSPTQNLDIIIDNYQNRFNNIGSGGTKQKARKKKIGFGQMKNANSNNSSNSKKGKNIHTRSETSPQFLSRFNDRNMGMQFGPLAPLASLSEKTESVSGTTTLNTGNHSNNHSSNLSNFSNLDIPNTIESNTGSVILTNVNDSLTRDNGNIFDNLPPAAHHRSMLLVGSPPHLQQQLSESSNQQESQQLPQLPLSLQLQQQEEQQDKQQEQIDEQPPLILINGDSQTKETTPTTPTPKKRKKILRSPDIYVFGAQELAMDTKHFNDTLQRLVGDKYKLLKYNRLTGLYIGIFVHHKLMDHISKKNVIAQKTRTGIANLYGNKGAVGISLRVKRTSFCFVNAHLAASRSLKHLEERIEDLVLIIQGLGLGVPQIDFTHQFHSLFLLGDLNFRIQNIDANTVIRLIENKNFFTLLQFDELNNLRAPFGSLSGRSGSSSVSISNQNDLSRQSSLGLQRYRFSNNNYSSNYNYSNYNYSSGGGGYNYSAILPPSKYVPVFNSRGAKQNEFEPYPHPEPEMSDFANVAAAASTVNIKPSRIEINAQTVATDTETKTTQQQQQGHGYHPIEPSNTNSNMLNILNPLDPNSPSIGNGTPSSDDGEVHFVKRPSMSSASIETNDTVNITSNLYSNIKTQLQKGNNSNNNNNNNGNQRQPITLDMFAQYASDGEEYGIASSGGQQLKSRQLVTTSQTHLGHPGISGNSGNSGDLKDNKSESFLTPVMAAIHQKKLKEEEQRNLTQYDENEFGTPKTSNYSSYTYDPELINPSRKGTLGINDAIAAVANDTNNNSNNGNNGKTKTKTKISSDMKNSNKIGSNHYLSESVAMLQQFVEGPIKFPPTYKFHKGTDMYNAKRVPAWCDRILWVTPSHPCITINQRVYASSDITPEVSDHRPVFSEFDIIHNASWNPEIGTEWMIKIRKLKLHLNLVALAKNNSNNNNNNNSGNSGTSNKNSNRNSNKNSHYRHHKTNSHTGTSFKDISSGVLRDIENSSHNIPNKASVGSLYSNISAKSTIVGHQIMPYLTIHSPMLQTVMRTTVGRRIVKNSISSQSPENINNVNDNNGPDSGNDLCVFEFSTKQFIIRVNDLNNIGNECLWIVMRDDNLLGDVDIIGATAIPLVDTEKLAKKYVENNNNNTSNSNEVEIDRDYNKYKKGQNKRAKEKLKRKKEEEKQSMHVYAHFRRDVTFATCIRGYLEGELQCVYFKHV